MLATDGRAGASCDRRETCVGRQMSSGSERPACYVDQESCRGPDADPWHAGQDRMKRVSEDQALDFFRNLVTLPSKRCQLLGQARQDDGGGLSTQHDDRLLRERLDDLNSPALAPTRGQLDETVGQLFLTERRELSGRGIPLDQIEYGGMIQVRPHDALERGMYLRQQAPDAIAGLSDLASQVIIEAAQHRELCDLVVSQLQRPQRMRHATCSFRDDVCVAGIRFCFTRMQISDAAHRKSRQVGDCDTLSSRHRNRQRADSCGLIDDEQHAAMLFELSDKCSKFGFVIRQSTVEQALSSEIQRHGMVRSFANVDADEDLDALLLFDISHPYPLIVIVMGQRPIAASLGIHVTSNLGNNPGPAPISDHQLPTRPGDNTPRIMDDWGRESCRAKLAESQDN